MQSLIGRTLGHYRIDGKIGAGGMGEVYRAHDERLERDVAVKVLPEDVAQDEDRLARFEREAKAVAKLDHPNILAIHDFGTEEGVAYAVMELLEGESLREAIAAGGLTTTKAAEHGRAIAEGLAAAHDKGIVHRDLKPENVFLTRDGRIKILDFGLAKLQLPEEDLATETPTATLETSPGTLIGTMAYMAPEQVQGQPADNRSDLFSLGVVLYEMLAGHRPFGGATSVETAAAILKEDPENLVTASPNIPASLSTVVSKCLEKRPEDRFSSAHDLSLTLGAIDSAAPPQQASAESFISKRWPHVLAIVIAALIAVFFVLPPKGLFEGPEEEPLAPSLPRIVVLPFENLGDPEDEYFADGMTEEITARLATVDGMQVISRTSARQYANTDKAIPEIGGELGVGYVLEGTVRWSRDEGGVSRIRITPQLIRVDDDTHLWADTYDRVLDDVFEVQSEIAQMVSSQLGVTLGGREKGGFGPRPTDNLEAYQAYLRGRYWATRPHFTYENWERAMAAYQEAVELDPGFGLAHAQLAREHALVRYFRHDLTAERLTAADESAEKAARLAPGSPRVHLALGYYRLWAYRDSEKAFEEFDRAARDRPDNGEILEARGNLLLVQGRWDEALDAFQRAFELSPRDAGLVGDISFVLWCTRSYRESVAAADQAIALAPDTLWPYLYKIFAWRSWKGSTEEVRGALESVPDANASWARWTWYWQEMYEGRYHDAIDLLESFTDDWIRIKIAARPNSLYAAQAYELLGDPGRARLSYEKALEQLEAEVLTSPDDPRMHSSLGIVYAALGRRHDAVREGIRATELLTQSMDGVYYIPYVIDLAHIYTILGDHQAALDQVEHLLDNPSWLSGPFLRMDPRWDPLKDDPRFQELLEKYRIEPAV